MQKTTSIAGSLAFLIPAVVVSLLASGCGGRQDTPERVLTPTEKNLRTLAMVYNRYQTQYRKSPTSLEELKNFVKGMPANQHEQMKITDPEKFFYSERDKQPFVLIVPPKPPTPPRGRIPRSGMMPMLPIIAYEKVGEDGMKFCVGFTGSLEELSEDGLNLKLQEITDMAAKMKERMEKMRQRGNK